MAVDGDKNLLSLRIEKIIYEADGILRYVLVDPAEEPLNSFDAGAHIDVHINGDLMRSYSLCGDPADDSCYQIAVLREDSGRGGSKALHEGFGAGQLVQVSQPRNQFPLSNEAKSHLLLAGGIGITPMIAMVHELERRGDDYEMHYCARSTGVTAFKSFLAPRMAQGRVHIHHDNGDPKNGLDISELLVSQGAGTHLYYCGPTGFMEAAKNASSHWQRETVHFEFFSVPVVDQSGSDENKAFTIRIKDSGDVFEIPADRSIVDVLRENGFPVDTQCEEGFCGTCLSRYVEGEPDHRDAVLDEGDRAQFMLICCSRAKSKEIVLDI